MTTLMLHMAKIDLAESEYKLRFAVHSKLPYHQAKNQTVIAMRNQTVVTEN